MEIIYPSLIEEAYRHSKKFHPEITKEAIYRHFYEAGLIKENGDPTEKALSEGVVKDYTEDWDLTFEEFLMIYPVFRSFDSKHFKKIEHFWKNGFGFARTNPCPMGARNLHRGRDHRPNCFF